MVPRERRRIHVYGVGAGKTGTRSVNGLFASSFRSAHEPEAPQLVHTLESFDRGNITTEQMSKFLIRRDRRLNLEMDSSAMNRRIVGLLVELFPASKFTLTVRDPYTLTDSMINMLLNLPPPSPVAKLRRDRLFGGPQYRHAPEEKALEDRSLHTLDGYLADYANTNRSVKKEIPADRLLVIRTDKLRESLPLIAQFLDIGENQLNLDRAHEFKTDKKHGILANIDPDFVDEKVRVHCSDLLREHFPEIRSIRDALHLVWTTTVFWTDQGIQTLCCLA
jgi:hypothetical protein